MLSLFVLLYVLIFAIFKTIVFFICAISVFFDNMLNQIKSNQIKSRHTGTVPQKWISARSYKSTSYTVPLKVSLKTPWRGEHVRCPATGQSPLVVSFLLLSFCPCPELPYDTPARMTPVQDDAPLRMILSYPGCVGPYWELAILVHPWGPWALVKTRNLSR